MEQKKKVCKLAFVHNALVLLFLVWVLFMPWEEAGSAFYYHRVLFFAYQSGGGEIVFGVFEWIFLISWISAFIFFLIHTVYAAMCLKNHDRMTLKKMKNTFGFSQVILTYILNIIAMSTLYIAIVALPVAAFSFFVLLALVIVVIIVGAIGKKKTKKAFSAENAQ